MHQLRKTDLISSLSATTAGTGHYAFRRDSVRLTTTDDTSQVVEYFLVGQPLSHVTNTAFSWIGPQNLFVQRYRSDSDGDGTLDGTLESLVAEGTGSPRVQPTADSPDALKNTVRLGEKLSD